MKKQVMLIAEKSSFLVRALVNKLQGEGLICKYVPCDINEINANWEDTSVVTLFMDAGDVPQEDIMHFLIDKLEEESVKIILIGEKNDITKVSERIPEDLVYKTFLRPINNEDFIGCIKELFQKVDDGGFMKNILIVDDDPNYLGLVREWLKGKYKVFMANSGLQAIKWLGKNKVDLILLDHEMPVTGGPQVLEMLRNDAETRDIPVMFLTGKGDKESVMAVLELKPEGYFLKNIERTELLEKLDEYFMLHK